jgi:23S rRNA (uracil1939-C5)-methyltransferase
MSLAPGELVELTIEKAAAGGRMIARHHGQVTLVSGAIPGERVRARVQRVERQVAFAATVDVLDPSPDRRPPDAAAIDLLCGGCLYAHVNYPRQVQLKADVIRDAFERIGRLALPGALQVEPSPDRAYRMRARLHVNGNQIGFYREGTHDLCDAAATGQLNSAAVAAARRAVSSLLESRCPVSAIELTENIAGDERVLHVSPAPSATLTDRVLDEAVSAAELTGCTGRGSDGVLRTAGVPVVTDPVAALTAGRATTGTLQRHAESFFQANRFLLPALVTTVLDAVPPEGDVLDLYAGVGLFSLALAACGRRGLTAVEGDRTSGSDLMRNASAVGGSVRVVLGRVEDHLRRAKGPAAATIIVDPPRTGISKDAMPAIAAHGASRIVYVSCDPPTMARDARRLSDAGYRLMSMRGFDLFPNTPHVEGIAVFAR